MTAFVEEFSFVDVNDPGQHKVIYTIKDSESGKVLETKERFVTVGLPSQPPIGQQVAE